LQDHLTDASFLPGGHAEKLFVPSSIDELSQILAEANESRIPVTVSGARTGTVGGAVPFGGYVISLEGLNEIKEIDKEKRTAIVQAGVILGDVQKAADAEGMIYPPDPTEWTCQIGGNVATNASGARSFRYGATRDYVNRLTVVIASGDLVELERGQVISGEDRTVNIQTRDGRSISVTLPTYTRPNVSKNASGYFSERPMDAIDLFIGSEGTLGVIAEIELRLLPKPQGFFSGIVFFESKSDLLEFVDEARQLSIMARKDRVATAPGSDMEATLLEYFDSNSLQFIAERFPEAPSGMAGAVFFEQQTTAENEDRLLHQWNELLEKHNANLDVSWFTTNDQDREKMRRFRHALPLAANERFAKHGFKKVSTDMAVPVDKFRSLLQFYDQTLSSCGIDYVIFGHIGDCHLHANLFPKTEIEAERARHIYGRCVAQALMLGGTVSAEHGIGKLKRKYLSVMMGERYLNEMAAVKRALDPNGILGRGNMFDESYL
jgi:D-lactate dehydrogenase (cytochrome)